MSSESFSFTIPRYQTPFYFVSMKDCQFRKCLSSFQVHEEVRLVHFMYSGWKGQNASDVPSATHGFLDLVEHAAALKFESGLPGPIAVHCK